MPNRRLLWSCTLLVAALAAGCAALGGASQAGPGPSVEAWITTSDRTRLLARDDVQSFSERAASKPRIDVDASRRFQTMVGFGAAITDASAWLIRNRLTDAQRQSLLQELFGRGDGAVGFGLVRLTIGASDFSRPHHSLNDRPPSEADLALAHFSIDENRGVVTIDSRTGAITRNLEYYALAHASRFVRPGAVRIESTPETKGLQSVAFRHGDDGSIVLIVCNSGAAAKTFSVRQAGRAFDYALPRESVITLVWQS